MAQMQDENWKVEILNLKENQQPKPLTSKS